MKIRILTASLFALSLLALTASAATAPSLGAAANFSRLDKDDGGLAAHNDVIQAYSNANAQACTSDLSGQSLNRTLTPGVYCFTGSATLNGTLRLDGGGNAGAVFIINIEDDLQIIADSNVILQGGTTSDNVFWVVEDNVTLGNNSSVFGTIISRNGDVLLENGALLTGHVFSINGDVTLQGAAAINCPGCVSGGGTSGTLRCAPATQTVGVGVAANFTATGGTGTYTWSATDLNITNPTGSGFTARYTMPGTHFVRVTSGSETAVCSVTVVGTAIPPVVPGLPNTGFGPFGTTFLTAIFWLVMVALGAVILGLTMRPKTE